MNNRRGFIRDVFMVGAMAAIPKILRPSKLEIIEDETSVVNEIKINGSNIRLRYHAHYYEKWRKDLNRAIWLGSLTDSTVLDETKL